jgi:CRP-like cAMP-binding protein
MTEGLDRLGEYGIFSELGPDELAQIAQIAKVEDFPSGIRLTEQGADADRLYLVLSGKAIIKVRTAEGLEGVLDEVFAGEELGWSAVTKPYRYFAAAETAEPMKAIVISGADLRRLAEADHRLGYHIAKGAGEVIARRYDRAIGTRREAWDKDLRALRGAERIVWDNGEMQLTTEAVLLGTNTDRPDVVPLEAIQEVTVEGGRVTIHVAEADVRSPVLEDPEELAELIRGEVRRMRLPYRRM